LVPAVPWRLKLNRPLSLSAGKQSREVLADALEIEVERGAAWAAELAG
jgi:hypothetical protein